MLLSNVADEQGDGHGQDMCLGRYGTGTGVGDGYNNTRYGTGTGVGDGGTEGNGYGDGDLASPAFGNGEGGNRNTREIFDPSKVYHIDNENRWLCI